MLKYHASEKVVYINGTHGTNAYGFYISTIMIMDEFGEGFAVAWSICNKNDTKAFAKVF